MNSVDLSKAIESVYEKVAEDVFLPLWRKHIGFFVDNTTHVATKDKVKSDKAVYDLVGYSQDFGAILNSANLNWVRPSLGATLRNITVIAAIACRYL
jgi:hypothetical protein